MLQVDTLTLLARQQEGHPNCKIPLLPLAYVGLSPAKWSG